jgi:hypothetical protein
MMRESGYNNTAQNPGSTAYGMGQFLDSTWGKYGPKTSDPYLQSLYTLEYIKANFNDPNGAAAHERAFNWYGNGTTGAAPGWGMVGENGPELVKFLGGETVVPNHMLINGRGYADGTLGGTDTAVGQQYTAGMNPAATAATIAASIAAITALTAAWKTAIAAADAATSRAKLIADIAAAITALNVATKAKDSSQIATTTQSLTDAKTALTAFDTAAKVAAEDAKIAADQAALATANQMAANRESWAFDHMSSQQQLADINTRMAAEQQYSDAWMTLAKQRETLQSQIDAAAQSALDAAMSKLTAQLGAGHLHVGSVGRERDLSAADPAAYRRPHRRPGHVGAAERDDDGRVRAVHVDPDQQWQDATHPVHDMDGPAGAGTFAWCV